MSEPGPVERALRSIAADGEATGRLADAVDRLAEAMARLADAAERLADRVEDG